MVDRSTIPDDSNWGCVFRFVADTEKRKISCVFVENFVCLKFPDVVFFEIALKDRSDFLKTFWRKLAEGVLLAVFYGRLVASEVWLVPGFPGNSHLELLLLWQIDNLHSVIDGSLD